MNHGIESNLRNRLTRAAELELDALSDLLQDFHLTDAPDQRSMLNGEKFSSKAAYKQMHCHIRSDAMMPIWRSGAPQRIRVFAWLLLLDRLHTRSNLFHKHILDTDRCPQCPSVVENIDHLFFTCLAARQVWTAMGLPALSFAVPDLWMMWAYL